MQEISITRRGRLMKNEPGYPLKSGAPTSPAAMLHSERHPATSPRTRQFVNFPGHRPNKKNHFEEQSRNVYENKGNADKMTCESSDIYVEST
jgi:hypothetical protein